MSAERMPEHDPVQQTLLFACLGLDELGEMDAEITSFGPPVMEAPGGVTAAQLCAWMNVHKELEVINDPHAEPERIELSKVQDLLETRMITERGLVESSVIQQEADNAPTARYRLTPAGQILANTAHAQRGRTVH